MPFQVIIILATPHRQQFSQLITLFPDVYFYKSKFPVSSPPPLIVSIVWVAPESDDELSGAVDRVNLDNFDLSLMPLNNNQFNYLNWREISQI